MCLLFIVDVDIIW